MPIKEIGPAKIPNLGLGTFQTDAGKTAEIVEAAVHVLGGAGLGPLEHHVLEEVADAHHFGLLVSGPGSEEESGRRGQGVGDDFGLDGESVGQDGLTELDGVGGGHPRRVAAPDSEVR